MYIKKAVKWLAGIAILAGIVRMAMTPMALVFGSDSPPEMWPGFGASVLMTVGFIGLYLAQAERIGVVGFISFIMVTIANILVTLGAFMTLAGYEPREDLMVINLLMMLCLTLGSLVFSFVTYRAKVLPRTGAVLMALFVLLMFSPAGAFLPLAWGLSYVLCGFSAWKQTRVAAGAESAVQA